MQGDIQLAEQLQLAKAEIVVGLRCLHQVAAAGAEGSGEAELIKQGEGVAERSIQGAEFGIGIRVEFAKQEHAVALEQGTVLHQGGQATELPASSVAVIAEGQFTPQRLGAWFSGHQQQGPAGIFADPIEVDFQQAHARQLLDLVEGGREGGQAQHAALEWRQQPLKSPLQPPTGADHLDRFDLAGHDLETTRQGVGLGDDAAIDVAIGKQPRAEDSGAVAEACRWLLTAEATPQDAGEFRRAIGIEAPKARYGGRGAWGRGQGRGFGCGAELGRRGGPGLLLPCPRQSHRSWLQGGCHQLG